MKPSSIAELVSRATLPFRRWPKWKSSPTTTSPRTRQSTSTSVTKSSADSCDPLLVEVHDERVIDPGRRQQRELLLEVGEEQGRRLGSHDHGRVTIEGHDRGAQALRGRPVPHLRDHRLVTEVDAVVCADGHRTAGLGRRATGGVADDLHGAERYRDAGAARPMLPFSTQ